MDNWVLKRVELTPDRLAVDDGKTRYTFREVLERCRRLGSALQELGAFGSQRVAMIADNDMEGYLIAVTLLLYGKTTVWLNKRLTDAELAAQMADAGIDCLLCDDASADRKFSVVTPAPHKNDDMVRVLSFHSVFSTADALCGRVGDDSQEKDATRPASSRNSIPSEFADDHVVSVMFTSGSTGKPKGIQQTVRNHFTSATSVALSLGVEPEDEWLCTVPIFHISGYSIILRGLIFGATVRLVGHFDAAEVDRILATEPVTWISVVPTMLKPLVSLRGESVRHGFEQTDAHYSPTFKGFILGGEKSDVDMLRRCNNLGMPVVRSYGMTETCSQIVGTGLADGEHRLLSSGKPYFTTQLRLAPGSSEIEIKTAALTPGYIGDDDGFEARKTVDGWYRTGDVGHVDEDGYVFVDGRLDNMLISGGEHVFPEEVERVYAGCPGVAEVAVTAESDEHWGQVPVAYIVPTDGSTIQGCDTADASPTLDVEALRTFGREHLAHYKVPQRFYAVDSLPKTSTGKVRRFLLRH